MSNPLDILRGWDAPRVLALINRLGGTKGAEALLRGDLVVTQRKGVRFASAPNSTASLSALFATPAQQIIRLLEINEAVWKNFLVTQAAIQALGEAPEVPPFEEGRLRCVVLLLEWHLGPAATLKWNWDACVHVHTQEGTLLENEIRHMQKGVRVRQGAKARPPGLRWAIAELSGSFEGHTVHNVRHELDLRGRMGMGHELPLIAALHPVWATSIGMEGVPSVSAPDLEVAPYGMDERFNYAPFINFDRDYGRVVLGADLTYNARPKCVSGFFLQ